MTKKDTVKKDDEEQSRRFIETAKILRADKAGKQFEDAINRVARHTEKNAEESK